MFGEVGLVAGIRLNIIQTQDQLILIENRKNVVNKIIFQAANPASVNVPLCLDLTLNWLLNVYDW